MTSDVKLREALEVIAEGGCECVGEHHPKELCAGCIARDALAAAPSAEPEGDGRVLRLAGRYSGVRYGNAAIPCEFDAVEIFEMLRAAPPAEPAPPETTLARDLLERIGLQNGRIDAPEEDVDRMESSATAKVVWHQYEFGAPVLVTMDDGQEFAGYLTTLPDLSDPDLDGVIHLPEVDEGTSLWLTVADMALLDECERIEIGRAAPPAETGAITNLLDAVANALHLPDHPDVEEAFHQLAESVAPCFCWEDAVNKYRHNRPWRDACVCDGHDPLERCDCPFCSLSLAAPVDPPTGPMDKLRESWKHSLPVDPPTGECERCGTCGMFPTEGNMVIQRTPDGGMRTVPCPDCSKTCENPACVDGTVPTRPQTGYPGALHEPCPDCPGRCDNPDDCPTYYDGCRCVEARRDGPERIYLEPPPGSPDTGRLWCEDDQSEDDRLWVPYVRADLAITPEWRRNAFAGQPPEEQNATAGDGEGEVVEGWVIEEDLRDMDFPKAYIRVWLGVVPRHSVPASVRIVRDPTGDAPGGEA